MDRRAFVRASIAAAGGGALLPTALMVSRAGAGGVPPASVGDSPYGPLRDEPDENGLLLPEGFTSRIIAVGGELVAGTDYEWPPFPDGAATFDDGEGGWYYVCNSEVMAFHVPDAGGVSSIHFDADGNVLSAQRILEGSTSNCAGGPTPWGTWLSCEEDFVSQRGRVWECDPTGQRPAVAHPAMGLFPHEAAAVDPVDEVVYMTEDALGTAADALLYRFTPDRYPDLSSGRLDALVVNDDGTIDWLPVPDPLATEELTRRQVPGATLFDRGEGCWYHDGWVYFCTTGDHTVHGLDLRNQRYRRIWQSDPDGVGVEDAVLSHVDNLTVCAGSGDLVVAEDGSNMELVLITAEGVVAPLVRVAEEHEDSEITGPVFNPARDRLYFSSQRGPSPRTLGDILPGIGVLPADSRRGGITYEVSGPFRGRVQTPTKPAPTTTAAAPETTSAPTTVPSPATTLAQAATTLAPAPPTEDGDRDGGGGGSGTAIAIGAGAVVAAAAVGGVLAWRARRTQTPPADLDSSS